jgi:DNA polymerase I-like protein with 3'-5' exonuclease and polymerase domains
LATRDKLLAYGMGPYSLFEQLNAMGYKITLEECRNLYNKYMQTFVEAITYLKNQKYTATRQFKMVNRNGRLRYFHKPDRDRIEEKVVAELRKKAKSDDVDMDQVRAMVKDKERAQLAAIQREGANFGIQSLNADFTKVSMHRCRKEFKKRGYDARMYNSVYDELVGDFHKSCAEEAHELQKEIMIKAAEEMLVQVPMEVEGHLAPVWQK